jgi:hypothetical protein
MGPMTFPIFPILGNFRTIGLPNFPTHPRRVWELGNRKVNSFTGGVPNDQR